MLMILLTIVKKFDIIIIVKNSNKIITNGVANGLASALALRNIGFNSLQFHETFRCF